MIALYGLAALVLLGVAFWRPMVALSFLVLLWPSYLVRTTIAGIPTTLLEAVLYGATAGVIAAMLMKRWKVPTIRFSKTTWVLIGLWSIAWVAATAMSPDHRASLGALKAWWFDPALFAALLFIVVRSAAERAMLVRMMVLSAAVVAIAGLYQLVFARQTLQEGRLSSFFTPVANYAAMYLAPLLVFGVSLIVSKILRPTWWLMVGIITMALAATLSYGGFAGLAAGLIVIWLWLPSSRLKKQLAIWSIVAAVMVVGGLSTTKNFGQHFNPGRSSGSVREQIWVTSWALIQKHPIFGIGPNTFEAAYTNEIPKHYFPPLEWLVAQPHDLYLALWLETGLLGLLTALAALGVFIHATLKLTKNAPTRPYAIAALAALTAMLIHGFVDTPYFKNDLVLIVAVLLALPWLGRHDTEETRT